MTQTRKEALTELLAKVEAEASDAWHGCGDVFGVMNGIKFHGAYNGSLDAAKALHEALLPRHYAQVRVWPVPEMCRVDIGGGHRGRDDNPARAWLIAILNALIAQEPGQ